MSGPATHPTVVAGVDGSQYALRALRWAVAEAARRNAPLRLVSAFDWTPELMLGHPGLRDTYREILWNVPRCSWARRRRWCSASLPASRSTGSSSWGHRTAC